MSAPLRGRACVRSADKGGALLLPKWVGPRHLRLSGVPSGAILDSRDSASMAPAGKCLSGISKYREQTGRYRASVLRWPA